jgi:uncharacterized protein (DUF1330 family)
MVEAMTAYIISDIEVLDPENYQEYVKLAPETVKLYGGRFIARGGQNETLEGEWQAKRLVILEFDSIAKAKQWLDSPEYAPAKVLRHKYAKTNMVVVEGT